MEVLEQVDATLTADKKTDQTAIEVIEICGVSSHLFERTHPTWTDSFQDAVGKYCGKKGLTQKQQKMVTHQDLVVGTLVVILF
jgi:hypothetical protein